MTRSRRATLALLACTVPLSAFAAERCAHEAPRTLPIDLDGVKTVVFDIGAQTLSVTPATKGANSLSARACASSPSMLPQLQFSQARQGDKLVVTASRERSMPLWDSNDRYAHLIVDARLPADLMIQVRVGAGEAVVDGFRTVTADVGSGELIARNVRETLYADVGSGEIEAENVGALHVVAVGSGELAARKVRGASKVGSVRSGELQISGAGGAIHIDAIGSGSASVSDVDGVVRVASIGSGSLRARTLRGDLRVDHVGSGSVRHADVAGRIDVDED